MLHCVKCFTQDLGKTIAKELPHMFTLTYTYRVWPNNVAIRRTCTQMENLAEILQNQIYSFRHYEINELHLASISISIYRRTYTNKIFMQDFLMCVCVYTLHCPNSPGIFNLTCCVFTTRLSSPVSPVSEV